MKKGKKVLFGLVCFGIIFGLTIPFSLPAAASPATIYVPDHYPTIQAAVDAASPGDTIVVREGTYVENVDVNKSIVLKGENMPVVDAAGKGSAITVSAGDCTVEGFKAINSGPGSGDQGIKVFGCNSNVIRNNIASNNSVGISLWVTANNTVIGNTVSDNYYGLALWGATDSTLRNNAMHDNRFNFEVQNEFVNDIDTSNTVDGKPIYYLVGKEDRVIDSTTDAGYVGVVNSANITVKDLVLTNRGQGVLLASTQSSTITNVSGSGIELWKSNNNTIKDNNVPDTIVLIESSGNHLKNNNIHSNYSCAIRLMASSYNTLTGNNVDSNQHTGICFVGYPQGPGSNNNLLYFNDFVNNSKNASCYDGFNLSINTWNSPVELTYTYNGNTYTGYLGNHWSDYTGSDADGDGIGNTPYKIDLDSDNYPLMEPFENYVVGEVPWVRVGTTGSTLAIRRNPGTSQELLKRVPDDWVLYVTNTHENSEVHDGYTWWEVEDVTDGLAGWAASEYLKTDDQEELSSKIQPLSTKDERVPVVLESVNHYYNDENTAPSLYSSGDKSSDGTNNNFAMLRNGDFPIELLLAMIAQESYGIDFDNESASASGGYGIMQITGVKNKGWGTRVKCYSPECKYYTNTKQGVYSNIKDGLRVLQWAYQSASNTHPDNIIEDAVWRYNHGGNDKIGDPYYLMNVANKLQNLEEYFGVDYKTRLHSDQLLDDTAKQALVDKLMNYQEIKLNSQAELRVYDSQGRVTGLIDREIRNEISNSDYYEEIVIVFSPSDSYIYEVAGTDEGSYGLDVTAIQDGEPVNFRAAGIPTASGAIHRYSIDWDALSQGEDGVTVQIDRDGDGVFEDTIGSDGELTHDEFILQTATLIAFDPDVLHLESKGKWVTAYVELPLGWDVADIDLSTVLLNEAVPAVSDPQYLFVTDPNTYITDYDEDGILERLFKFDRAEVQQILDVGEEVEITITGEVGEVVFEGSDTIRVIDG